jgi:HSP20 family molecular chaperone IbpA
VEIDRVEAVYQNGFLKVTLPKAHPKHIPID